MRLPLWAWQSAGQRYVILLRLKINEVITLHTHTHTGWQGDREAEVER